MDFRYPQQPSTSDPAEIDLPFYPFDQLLLTHLLPEAGGLLVHAAGIVANGRGCLFPGQSGAGKSTFTRQALAIGLDSLSDDRIAVRGADAHFDIHGTPWPGELGIARNARAPLRAIVFPQKAENNRIAPISPARAAVLLLRVCSVLWYERDLTDATLAIVDTLVRSVPAFELRCRPEPAAAELVRDTILAL